MNFAPLMMFGILLLILMTGIPIAFTLLLVAIAYALIFIGPSGLSLITSAAWGAMNNFTLIAIPLFIFMAVLLEKSGIVSDLYDTFYKWSGGIRGGLAVATVIVGAILGAVSGVVAAGVIGLGLVALPSMEKYKYNRKISMGAIMSGGTLGQLIPPSLNMVVYGSVTGVSVGSLFAGGITTGCFLALLYILYILIRSYINKDLCPALPKEERVGWNEKFKSLGKVFLPAVIIVLVLGSILSGAATATEGAAVGAFCALGFSLITRRLNKRLLYETAMDTLRVTSMVGWIIVAANAFGAVFSATGGNAVVQAFARSVPGGGWSVFAICVLFIIFLGMFLETVAIIMLAAPIVSPIIAALGFDTLWWGLVFMMLLQVAFLSPPFGFALFYLKGITPKYIQIEEIYASALPFLGLQLLGVLFVILLPEIALWLPRFLMPS